MRSVALLVVADPDDPESVDVHGSESAARRTLPGVVIDRVVIVEEPRLGAWLRAHRARRCRTTGDVLDTPERQQPVVVDIDLPRGSH
ncbi:MAG: hypothetical protein AAF805_05385 [Planctomycetota bacterium]